MSECFDGQAEGSGKSEVSEFQSSTFIYEKVLGFEISVDDPSGVAVVESVAELIDKEFDLVGSHGGFVLAHVFFEVIVDQFKH
jgi:hypothetical protein